MQGFLQPRVLDIPGGVSRHNWVSWLVLLLFFRPTAPSPSPPRRNLCFLKTHKTGGSTLQHIFFRYAWKNDVIIGLPDSDVLFSSYYKGRKFSAGEIRKLPANRSVNMLIHHLVFNYQEVKSNLEVFWVKRYPPILCFALKEIEVWLSGELHIGYS